MICRGSGSSPFSRQSPDHLEPPVVAAQASRMRRLAHRGGDHEDAVQRLAVGHRAVQVAGASGAARPAAASCPGRTPRAGTRGPAWCSTRRPGPPRASPSRRWPPPRAGTPRGRGPGSWWRWTAAATGRSARGPPARGPGTAREPSSAKEAPAPQPRASATRIDTSTTIMSSSRSIRRSRLTKGCALHESERNRLETIVGRGHRGPPTSAEPVGSSRRRPRAVGLLEPRDRPGQPLLEGDVRLPAQRGLRPLDVGLALLRVVGGQRQAHHGALVVAPRPGSARRAPSP